MGEFHGTDILLVNILSVNQEKFPCFLEPDGISTSSISYTLANSRINVIHKGVLSAVNSLFRNFKEVDS
jgi:hypothetical protein